MSRTASVSSQLSGKIDGESVSSGDVSELVSIPLKEEAENLSNHLNNNVTAEQTPNGATPVEIPAPEPPKTVEAPPDTEKTDLQKPTQEPTTESSKPVEPPKESDAPSSNVSDAPPSTSRRESVTANDNGVEVASIDSASEVASEETDQIGELPTSSSSTPPTAVSNKEPQSSQQLGVNACASVSDQLTKSSSGMEAITEEEKRDNEVEDTPGKKTAESEQSSFKTDKETASVDSSTSTESDKAKQVARGTSFNSLNKIPAELAAANKAAKESVKTSAPIREELPTDEALAIDILDEVLSSDLANDVTKTTGSLPASLSSDLSGVLVTQSGSNQPPSIGESPDEVFAEGDGSPKFENQPVAKATNEMNGNAPRLQVNGTQVSICALDRFRLHIKLRVVTWYEPEALVLLILL